MEGMTNRTGCSLSLFHVGRAMGNSRQVFS